MNTAVSTPDTQSISLFINYTPHLLGETLLNEGTAFEGTVFHSVSGQVIWQLPPTIRMEVAYQYGLFNLALPEASLLTRHQHQAIIKAFYLFPAKHGLTFRLGGGGYFTGFVPMASEVSSPTDSYLQKSQYILGPSLHFGFEFPLPLSLSLFAEMTYSPHLWLFSEDPDLPTTVQGLGWQVGLDYDCSPFLLNLAYDSIQHFQAGWRMQSQGLKMGVGYRF